METIRQAVHAAEKVIWGESNPDKTAEPAADEEPVAGVQGEGTATDPYDAGNASKELADQHAAESKLQSQAYTGGLAPRSGSSTTPAGGTPEGPMYPQGQQQQQSKQAQATPAMKTAPPPTQPSPTAKTTMPQQSHARAPSGSSAGTAPTYAAAAAPGPTRTSTAPQGMASASGGLMATGAVPAPVTATPSAQAGVGQGQGQGHTGSHHVRSSGYAAEGGDFDARQAGAGSEADRLLEEHGDQPSSHRHHGGPSQGQGQQPSSAPRQQQQQQMGSGGNNAPGTSAGKNTHQHHSSVSKVKEKLHIGKHH
ncbi:hypothetical protein FQN55_001548 [Onygenales sp. PD_40]|nr:hypothetical protein FQN55_001548 [Onygenales sp. PD_40]